MCVRACEKRRVSVQCYFWLLFPPFLTIWTLVTKAVGRLNEVKAIYTDTKIYVPWGVGGRKLAMPPTHKFLNTWLSNLRIYIYIANIRQAFALFGCYAANVGSCLPTFRDSLFLLPSRAKQSKKNAGQAVDLYRVTHCIGSLKSLLPATSVRPYITLTALIKMTCLATPYHSLWNSSDSSIQYRCRGRNFHNRHDPYCHELSLANCFLGGHEMILVHLIRWYTQSCTKLIRCVRKCFLRKSVPF